MLALFAPAPYNQHRVVFPKGGWFLLDAGSRIGWSDLWRCHFFLAAPEGESGRMGLGWNLRCPVLGVWATAAVRALLLDVSNGVGGVFSPPKSGVNDNKPH